MSGDTVTRVPSCPQCGALVGRQGHTCHATAADPNWGGPRPVTDPAAIREYIAAVRDELAKHRPPAPNPAPGLPVLTDQTDRRGRSMP